MRLNRAFVAAVLAAAMAISAGAAFTPSVEYKEAPTVVEKTDEEGNVSIGEILDEKGEVVTSISLGSITLTAISEVKLPTSTETPATPAIPGTSEIPGMPQIPGLTEEAVAELPAEVVESLIAVAEELTVEFEKPEESELVQTIAKELNDAPVENIVVSDVLYFSATPEIVEAMSAGATVSVSMVSQGITKESETKITIYQKHSVTGKWVKVPFKIDENGVITLELKAVGQIVIFRDNEAAPIVSEAPESPATNGDLKGPGNNNGNGPTKNNGNGPSNNNGKGPSTNNGKKP